MPKNRISKNKYLANGILTIREKVCCDACRSRRATLAKVFRFCASGEIKTKYRVREKFQFSIVQAIDVFDELAAMGLISFGEKSEILIEGKDA